MAKKIFIVGFAMIILCLCCGICFAAEDNSVSLGNEIMQSIDKTGESMENVVSGNWLNDMGNTARDTGNDMRNDVTGITGTEGMTGNDNRGMTGTNAYNTTRTTVEGTTTGTTNAMSTTTWMWIILVVAAIIIIAAIWYYATQTND